MLYKFTNTQSGWHYISADEEAEELRYGFWTREVFEPPYTLHTAFNQNWVAWYEDENQAVKVLSLGNSEADAILNTNYLLAESLN
jgi:hypothetical protein